MRTIRNSAPHTLAACALLLIAASPAAVGQDNGRVNVADRESDVLEVGVGQSRVLDIPWPVTRVSITQPAIADVEVLTPRQLLLTGVSIGSTDLVVWGEQEEELYHARVNTVIDLEFVSNELRKLFPRSTVSVTQSQDIVVVSGELRRVEQVEQLQNVLDAWGVKYVNAVGVAGVQQVKLRVRIAEVDRRAIRALGINALWGGEDFFGGSVIGSDSGGPVNPVSIFPDVESLASSSVPFVFGEGAVSSGVTLFGGFPGADLELFLQALEENQYVRILAEPTLTALSGAEASFLAGGEFPVPIVQGSTAGAGTSITIEYKEFGVRLAFRPTVLGDGSIRLHVAPEVSELTDFGAVVIEGFQIPSVLTRRADTTLEMMSGQTFAIAGLLSESVNARTSRIPLLGDLPILGSLFRSVRYATGETELVVLVSVDLVEPQYLDPDLPIPGDLHITPNDWELYLDGQIEGAAPSLDPADISWLRNKGLHRLKGPGAWTTHAAPPQPPLPPRERGAEVVEPESTTD